MAWPSRCGIDHGGGIDLKVWIVTRVALTSRCGMDHGDGIYLEVCHGFEGVDFFLLAVPINNLPLTRSTPV